MALALTRNDVLVRTRKSICCVSRLAEDISLKYSNGIFPCKAEINKVNLLNAYVDILRCYEPPITEVLATGTCTLTGTSGTIWITVNSVPITTDAVAFTTNLATTATAVATAANTDTSIPNYTATAVGSVLTIRPVAGSGATANGFVISSINTGTMGITSITNMAGGVTGRVDADNCFTLARAKNVFSDIEERGGDIIFAPPGFTYVNPSLSLQITENILREMGDAVETEGDAAVPAEPLETQFLKR